MINHVIAITMLSISAASAVEATGLHQFCESLPHVITRNTGWDAGCDSRYYSWKSKDGIESAKVEPTVEDKVEGNISHRFTLNSGWSRWILEMNPDTHRFADISPYKKMLLSMKSESAKKWDSFGILIGDEKTEYRAQLSSLGFSADGAWHKCTIDMSAVAKSGVDLTHITRPLMIEWGGGVDQGDRFWLDDVHFE